MLIKIKPNIVNENQFRFYNQVTKVLKKKYIIDIFLFFLKILLNLEKMIMTLHIMSLILIYICVNNANEQYFSYRWCWFYWIKPNQKLN